MQGVAKTTINWKVVWSVPCDYFDPRVHRATATTATDNVINAFLVDACVEDQDQDLILSIIMVYYTSQVAHKAWA